MVSMYVYWHYTILLTLHEKGDSLMPNADNAPLAPPRTWLFASIITVTRSAYRMSTRDIAKVTGLSNSFISKVERLDPKAGNPGKKSVYGLASALFVPGLALDPKAYGDILWNAIWAPTTPKNLELTTSLLHSDYFTLIGTFGSNPTAIAEALGLPHPPIIPEGLHEKRAWLWMILTALENLPTGCLFEMQDIGGEDHFQWAKEYLEELESPEAIQAIRCKRRYLHPTGVKIAEASEEEDITGEQLLSAWNQLMLPDRQAIWHIIQRMQNQN